VKTVVTFYEFVRLSAAAELRDALDFDARQLSLKGTIVVATEGINGTIAGEGGAVAYFTEQLAARREFASMAFRYSSAEIDNPVFYRLKVRLKPEIVAFGLPGISPAQRTGVRVSAEKWNALLADPQVIVIDARNSYEIAIGTFPGARDPATKSFRQFPGYVVAELEPEQHKKVALFCTGGIRCEKASTYMLARGFESVFQLDGGILQYLESVTPADNRWQGECFVFDQRVSVDDRLAEGSYRQCFACRRLLDEQALSSGDFVAGVSCPHCVDEHNETRREAFRGRQRQIKLAADRGELHIGEVATQGSVSH